MMSYPFGPFVHLLILTAQRRDEVAGMRWDELDLEAAMWTIPKERAKNVKAHQVPLPPMAVDFLREIPKLSEHVFTTTGRTPISGYSKAKVHLDLHILKARAKAVEDAGGDPKKCEQMADWTFHDLRRTVATGMARMNVQPHVVEKILNHVQGTIRGVAAIYNRHGYLEESRAALEKWAQHVRLIGR